MAHHSGSDRGMSDELRKALGLGATGRYPQGQLAPEDEGEIKIAVAADTARGKVVVDFGKPVAWMGFDPQQALALADSIRAKAVRCLLAKRESDGKRKTVCVDLDGTLAHYEGWKGPEHIGMPRPGAVEFTRALDKFANVVVFTTRAKADFEDRPDGATPESLANFVRGWLDGHGFAYTTVYAGQGKPIASAYVDDRAVPLPTNPSEEDFAHALDAVRILC